MGPPDKLQSRTTATFTEFPLTPSQLGELHDPKSMASFSHIFDNKESNLYNFLKTDKVLGLSITDEDIKQTDRYKVYGDNRVPDRLPKSFFELAWTAFQDQTMILLTVAAIVSFGLGLYEVLGQPPEFDPEGNKITKVNWVEGVAIMVAVLVVIVVTATNDYQKELQFVKLTKKKEDREVIVIRNGSEHLISIHDLLVGDLISLQTGDVVPADSILIKGSCECDESALTGESDTIKKVPLDIALDKYNEITSRDAGADIGTTHLEKVPDPMLISGSKLFSGLGNAVITSVGPNSVNGRVMMSLKAVDECTPLQERLSVLADNISIYGSTVALILFIILFSRFLSYLPFGRPFHDLTPAQKGSKFMTIFITAITVIVVAVPEGLPLAVTLALAFATTRMTKDGNLVRILRSCETMGSVTAICSDKTGTLTENKMSVVKGIVGDTYFDDTSDSLDKSIQSQVIFYNNCDTNLKIDVLINIALNSTAFENKEFNTNGNITENPYYKTKRSFFPWSKNNKHKHDNEFLRQDQFIGSKTETALLSLATKSLNMTDLQKIRNDPTTLGVQQIIQVIPFESSRKWSGVVVKNTDGMFRFYIKGAAEMILCRCNSQTLSNGTKKEICSDLYKEILNSTKKLSSCGLRTISLAHKDFPNISTWPPLEYQDPADHQIASPELLFGSELEFEDLKISPSNQSNDEGLTLDCIVGIQDPLRRGVKDSIGKCQSAGITIRMVTGDNVLTARSIAKECGILDEYEYDDPECILEGPAFRKLQTKERIRIISKLRVLARSSPEDKRVLVETLKKMGDVVAVTGDGTNDAPALKLADVGFSMGLAGTEVAREASDIILMTDDFASIVNAVKWGRCVSISIKKFIQFQLTVNITAVILTFITSAISSQEHSVLTAVQLLWVNLIMDTLAALALATDKPDRYILDRTPKGRNAPLISVSMWKMILGQSALQLVVTFILHFYGGKIFFPHKEHLSAHNIEQLNAMTFNTFVWLQFFKLIVTRKLDEGDGISNVKDRISLKNLNFFEDLLRNYYFLGIMCIIGGFQVLIMFVGGAAFSIGDQTGAMWATSIGCGFLSLPIGVIIRICPDEYALSIFPEKLVKLALYIFGLGFLRSDKMATKDEESLLTESERESNLIKTTAFERARSDMMIFKAHRMERRRYLNPVNIYRRWRNSKINMEYTNSEDDRSIIATLTMVPTLVGGAVGGFSHFYEDLNIKDSNTKFKDN